MRQIYKTIFRELRTQKMRSFLSFLCLFVIVAFPIAMFSIEPSIDASVQYSNRYHQLAHLDIRYMGNTESLTETIQDVINSNESYQDLKFEERFTTSYQLYENDQWYYSNIVGINPNHPPTINKLETQTDFAELTDDTAFILESFAKELNVEIGDSIDLFTPAGKKSVRITGLVKSIEFLSYNLALKGSLYLTINTLANFEQVDILALNSVAFYFPEPAELDFIKEFVDQIRENTNSVEIQIYYFWYVREFSISAIFQDVLNLTSQVLFVMACAIILTAGIVIFLIMKRYAVEQRKQTGMLYAYGFPSKIILRVFMLRTFFLSIIAIVIGVATSYGLLQLMTRIMIEQWGIPTIIIEFSPISLIIVPILVLLSSQLFTFFAARSNVKLTPYEAIRGTTQETNKKYRKKGAPHKKIKSNLIERIFSIQIKYPLRNLSRNKQRGSLITFAFIGAVAISFALLQTNASINGTFGNYFDSQISWDIKTEFNNVQVNPDLSMIYDQYPEISKIESVLQLSAEPTEKPTERIILRGLEVDSELYELDMEEGSWFSSDTAAEGIISSYSADPLEIEIGDSFRFWLLGQEISIKIVGIARDLDIPNSFFMQLPAIEQLLGILPVNVLFMQTDDLSADEFQNLLIHLNEDPQFQLAVEKEIYENQMNQMINTQLLIVKVTIVLALIISFMIIFVTGFISILERKREIALQRVFGFQKGQIWSQIFLEMGVLIFIAVMFGIILGGEGLARLLNILISKLFFELDMVYSWQNYSIIIGFATGCVLFSTIPGIKLLQRQYLAEEIQES